MHAAASDAGLALPIVVIAAGRDSHEAIVHAAPHRRLVVADGADHDIPEQRPETIVQAAL